MRPAKLLDGYLTKEELAAELGYSSVSLKRWLAVGYGPTPTYLGPSILFSRESVTKWLREQEGKKSRGRTIRERVKTAQPASRSAP
jgi:hypothetical protein